jgi:hypothetical protein
MQHLYECGDISTSVVSDNVTDDDTSEAGDILEIVEDEGVGFYRLLGSSWEKPFPCDSDEDEECSKGDDDDEEKAVIPTDYRSIAENVLAQLNEEYTSLVSPSVKEEQEEIKQEQGIQLSSSITTETEIPLSSSLHREGNDEKNNNHSTNTNYDSIMELSPAPTAAVADSNRIQQAVQSIRLRQDENFVQKMDAGWTYFVEQHRHHQTPWKHCIIPSKPLAAFVNTTTKAIQATSNLTRSATLAEIMVRLNFLPLRSAVSKSASTTTNHHRHHTHTVTNTTTNTSSANFYNILTIHIVGADSVECSSPSTIQKLFCPFIRWMEFVLQQQQANTPPSYQHGSFNDIRNFDEIHLILIGPNIPQQQDQVVVNLLPKTCASNDKTPILKNSTATCITRLYHEYITVQKQQRQEQVKKSSLPPSNHTLLAEETLIVVAFNAGIWGYNDWSPTIQLLSQQPNFMKKAIPLIVTAYTIEESVNDLDTIEHILKTHSCQKRILWSPEINPYHSRVPRKTTTQPLTCKSTYYENGAWHAWEFGEEV